MFYKPKHFTAKELLPPNAYSALGDNGLYLLMDWRILWTIDSLRKRLGPITINNWHTGGSFSQRGFRDDANTGARYSQHRFGRAVDFDIKGLPAAEFRAKVKSGELNEELQYITVIEESHTVVVAGKKSVVPATWNHVDCRAPADLITADILAGDPSKGIKFIQA